MIDEQAAYERAERTWVKAKPEPRKCANEQCGHTLSQSNKENICRQCQEKARTERVRKLQAQAWPKGQTVPAGAGRADSRQAIRRAAFASVTRNGEVRIFQQPRTSQNGETIH